MAAVVSGLAEAGVKASLRSLRGGPHVARFAPHYYNTDAELDRAVELLP